MPPSPYSLLMKIGGGERTSEGGGEVVRDINLEETYMELMRSVN